MLNDHAIPDWIYEPLPYAYGAFGSISAYQFDHRLGQLAGLLMIVAGFIVWFMRRQYRRAREQAAQRRLHAPHRESGVQLRYYKD